MPLAPTNPSVDEEEAQQPAAPKPRIGTTGGEIPDQQSEIDARKPVQWAADPAARQAQVRDEITRRRAERFQQEHPFTPSSWQPKPPTDAQGNQIPQREDREFAASAEDQFQYQQQTARAAEIAKRRGAIEQQKNSNDQLEAQYRGTGQQFYTDAHGRIQPVIEAETNRPLFHKTGWEASTHPETGKPTLMMRDKYGQRQFKEAPVVASLDPSDDQMYYKMPDGTTAPAGSIDEFTQHPNYQVAKAALAARTRNIKAVHQQALQPMKMLADQAASQLEDAKVQIQSIDSEIEKSTKLANDNAGTPLGDGYLASLQQLQEQRDALDAQTKPKGDLARRAARARAGYTVAAATAMRETFAAQHDEIAARVKATGKKLENDPTYQANKKGMDQADEILRSASGEFDTTGAGPSSTPVQQSTAGATKEAAPGPLERSEPYAAEQNGVKNIGAVPVKEFARRYGDGRGPVKPDDLIKLYQRSKAIDETLADKGTTLNQTVRDSMQKEKDYIDALTKQRFARLPEDQQTRVSDVTRDPNWWDKLKGGAKSGAEEAASGGASFFKGLAVLGDAGGTMHLGAYPKTKIEQELEARTPKERMDSIKRDPLYQLGTFIQEAAHQTYSKNPHEDEGQVSKAINAAVGAAGGFAPIVASGAAAPVTIGLQTAGDEMDRIYDEQVKKGVDPEKAADLAREGALKSGAVQAAIFELLPKPLQKAGSKFIVDKIAGSALQKFIAGRIAQGAEGAVLGGVSAAGSNIAAGRDVGEGVSSSAAGLGLAQMAMPRAGGGKPKGGESTSGAKPKTPLTPEQQAAETEFQKKLAEPEEQPKPSTAKEAAQVFEPALKEKANTPPPAKSAAESAKAITEAQDTEEAGSKVLSQQEGKAQKLVDEIQSASGKSRDEILATRKGRDVAEWNKELEAEAKYQKSPLTVDPERRATELKADLKRLDAEWAKHLDKTAAEAEIHSQIQGDKDKAAAQFAATKARHDSLMARRDAIEQQLSEAERVRQSNKGGADLREDLGNKSGRNPPPDEASGSGAEKPKSPTPPEGGVSKSDYDQYQEVQQKWKAEIAKGNSDPNSPEIRDLWKQNEEIKNRHDGMPPEAPAAGESAPTKTSKELATEIMAKNPNADAEATKMLLGQKKYEVRDIPISEVGEVFGSKTVQPDVVKKYEATKSDEPIVLNRVEGEVGGKLRAIDGKHRLTAARNRGDKTIKAYVPVDEATGKTKTGGQSNAVQKQSPSEKTVRDESKGGEGVRGENAVDQSAAPAREAASPVREAVAPDIAPPKDAAPISAKVEKSTAESVEGDKINKGWTAFDKGSGTLGVPRAEMPQIKSEHRGALVNFLKARGIPVKSAMVMPEQLKPTQAEFSPEKVQKAREHEGSDRPILISSDGHLVDGHHQWMAGLQDDPKTPMPAIKLDAPIDRVLAEMKEFPSTETTAGAKPAAKEAAQPATKRLSDRAIEALKKARIETSGKVFDVTGAAYVAAHNSAIDLAILGIRAGRALTDVVKLAVDRFKAKYPQHTPEHIEKLEGDIRAAAEAKTVEKPAAAVLESAPTETGRSKIRAAWDKAAGESDLKKTLSSTRDAADNLAGSVADETHSSVSNELNRSVPKEERKAAADALAFYIESGGDAKKLTAMREQIQSSEKASPKWKEQATAAIDYALANDAKLKSTADLYREFTDKQVEQEKASGLPTLKRENYVMHAQDVDTGSWLDQGGGMSPTGSSSRKNRTFDTFADSIAAGIDPKTLNALDLLRSRVRAGQTGINLREWQASLKNYTDPTSKEPIAMQPKRVDRADGSFYFEAPKGYENEMIGGTPIAVKKEYAGTIGALTDPSWWSKTKGRRLVQKLNGGGKSINLLIDTFHLGRLALRQSILKSASLSDPRVPLPSFSEGKTILEHSPEELAKMAREGEISPEALPDLLEKKKNLNLMISAGLNTGHVADALHQEMVRKLPFLGDVNKFIFEKFQRGAMTEAALMEFTRQSKSYSDLKPHEVARKVASDINTRFGNLGRQGIFKSRTAQDIARLIWLAPQWNEGLVRSELGGAGQIATSVVDAVRGKRFAMGALGRDMIAGTVGIFVANQIINQMTRGKFTWENPEEGWGSKLSAWIPDSVGGKGSGFFLNPLGVTAEISHLLLNSYERKGSGWEAMKDFAKSRSSSTARPVMTWLTGKDALGGNIRTGDMGKEILKSSLPAPIGASAAVSAIRGAINGGNTETYPGQFQKQVMQTFGLKTDTAPSPEQRIQALAKNFKETKGIEPSAEFYAGDYTDLTNALRRNNPKDIRTEIDDLLKKRTPDEIRKHYQSWGHTPFTGQKNRETEFIRTLNSEQRAIYAKAQKERQAIGSRALSTISRLPYAVHSTITK